MASSANVRNLVGILSGIAILVTAPASVPAVAAAFGVAVLGGTAIGLAEKSLEKAEEWIESGDKKESSEASEEEAETQVK